VSSSIATGLARLRLILMWRRGSLLARPLITGRSPVRRYRGRTITFRRALFREQVPSTPPDQLGVAATACSNLNSALIDRATMRSGQLLQFSEYDDAQWRRFNSGRQYVNRLRHSD
jgi:hypothetical protein